MLNLNADFLRRKRNFPWCVQKSNRYFRQCDVLSANLWSYQAASIRGACVGVFDLFSCSSICRSFRHLFLAEMTWRVLKWPIVFARSLESHLNFCVTPYSDLSKKGWPTDITIWTKINDVVLFFFSEGTGLTDILFIFLTFACCFGPSHFSARCASLLEDQCHQLFFNRKQEKKTVNG